MPPHSKQSRSGTGWSFTRMGRKPWRAREAVGLDTDAAGVTECTEVAERVRRVHPSHARLSRKPTLRRRHRRREPRRRSQSLSRKEDVAGVDEAATVVRAARRHQAQQRHSQHQRRLHRPRNPPRIVSSRVEEGVAPVGDE